MRSYKNGKLTRTDHRAANPNSVTRRDRVRDPVGRKTIEQEHDQQGRFARSIKANYIDSDGDGLKDMYLRANRSPATTKPDYRNLGTPQAPVIPVDPPIEGPDSLTTELLAPAVGPGSLDASLQPPVAGPGSLVATEIPAWNGNQNSVSFDGANDYCSFTEEDLSSGVLTFSAWVNFSNLAGGEEPIIADDGNLSHWHFKASNGYFYLKGLGGQSFAGPWSGTPATDTWYHMMLIDDGLGNNNSSVKAYIDGAFVANFKTTGIDGFRFDTIAKSGGRYFPGKIDEVAIWQNDQTANIAAIYNSGVPGDLSDYNPLHWYRMGDNDGGSGTTITDQGSGGNNGTLTNSPTFSSDVPTLPPPPMSLSFDGTDETAILTDTGVAVDSQLAYTFSCWVKLNTVTNNSGFFTVDGGTNINDWPYNNWWRIESSGDALSWYHSISGTSYKIVSGTLTGAGLSAFTTGTWYHIMCTWNGSELKSYVNGTLLATTANVTEWNGRADRNFAINIGLNRIENIDGNIDEWAWLPTDESDNVSAIYNSGSPTDLSSYTPLFYYRMGEDDGGTGSTVTNQGSETGDLTLVNSPTFSTDTPT